METAKRLVMLMVKKTGMMMMMVLMQAPPSALPDRRCSNFALKAQVLLSSPTI